MCFLRLNHSLCCPLIAPVSFDMSVLHLYAHSSVKNPWSTHLHPAHMSLSNRIHPEGPLIHLDLIWDQHMWIWVITELWQRHFTRMVAVIHFQTSNISKLNICCYSVCVSKGTFVKQFMKEYFQKVIIQKSAPHQFISALWPSIDTELTLTHNPTNQTKPHKIMIK